MKEYPCPRCNHPFPTPSKLKVHLNSKRRCDGEHECNNCNKRFKDQYYRNSHQKICKGKKETVQDIKRDRDFARQALAVVEAQASASSAAGNGQVVQHIQQNIQQQNILNLTVNNNVVLNVGDEDCSHLDTNLEALESVLGIKEGHEASLIRFCRLLRCDPSVPQNHNLLVLNPQDSKVVHRSNGQWKEGDADKALLFALNCDAVSLSNKINDRDELYDRPDLHAYKFDFLVHNIQSKCQAGDMEGLRSTLDSLKDMYHDLTKSSYLSVDEARATTSAEPGQSDVALRIRLAELEVQKIEVQKMMLELQLQAQQKATA